MKTKKLKINDIVDVIGGEFEGDKGTIMQIGVLKANVRLSSNGAYENINIKDLEFVYKGAKATK